VQVSLNGSAFNVDGSSAARVSAAGSNRAQLRNGLATFKSIRLQAREEGEYKLTIGSHSKKIAIQEASVVVKVSPCHANMLHTPVHVDLQQALVRCKLRTSRRF
jgi:hypothetical protein